MTTLEQMKDILADFYALFPQGVKHDALRRADIWFNAFKGINADEMEQAVALVTLQVTQFPSIADVKQALQTISDVRSVLNAEVTHG